MTETVETPETTAVDLGELATTITQREWLLICRALEASKDDILERSELLMPAIAWVHLKRAHGGADWDKVLDLTDLEVIDLLGLNTDEVAEEEITVAPFDGPDPSGSGISNEQPSASPPASDLLTTTT
jgi:hypothetical protein